MSHDGLDDLKGAQQGWEQERLAPALDKARRELMPSDLPQKPLYTPLDTAGADHVRDLGFPGDYPYTRGIYPEMYRQRLWGPLQTSV